MLHAMILIIFFLIHFAEAYNFSYTAKRKSLIVNFMRIYYYFDAFIFLIFISWNIYIFQTSVFTVITLPLRTVF